MAVPARLTLAPMRVELPAEHIVGQPWGLVGQVEVSVSTASGFRIREHAAGLVVCRCCNAVELVTGDSAVDRDGEAWLSYCTAVKGLAGTTHGLQEGTPRGAALQARAHARPAAGAGQGPLLSSCRYS